MYKALIIVVLALGLGACGKEENKPLYPMEKVAAPNTPMEFIVRSRIQPMVVKTNGLRRLVRTVVGWIPLVGDLVELPLNLVNALLPDLPFTEILDLPRDASIDDPEVMELVESVEIYGIYLFVTPEDLRTVKNPKRCGLFSKCKDQDLEFMKEIRIYLERKDNSGEMVLLARGVQPENMSPDKKLMNVIPVPGINLRDYLGRMDEYQIKTIIDGRIPRNDLYLEGNVVLKIRLNY